MVTAVAMDSRVQNLNRVRGGSYTGEAVEVFINTVPEKYLYTSPEAEKPEKYLCIYTFYNTFPGPKKYFYIHHAGEVFMHFSGAGEAGEAGEVFIYTRLRRTVRPAIEKSLWWRAGCRCWPTLD